MEINCETDFVAKNEKFQQFCDEIAGYAADSSANLEGNVPKPLLKSARTSSSRAMKASALMALAR